MTYRPPTVDVFTPLEANYITDKQVSSNVVTLTTLTEHGYQVGDKVWFSGVDTTIQTNLVARSTITAVTSTTFSFSKTTADMAPAPVRPYGNVFKYHSWTKPPGATLVRFTLCGAGGGGGSGARRATTSNRTGGSGGGGGGWMEVEIPASEIPDTPLFVTVPNGGYGGLPITSDDTVGMNGGAGGGNSAARVTDTEVAYVATLSFGAVSGLGGNGGIVGTAVGGGLGGGNTQFAGGAGGNGNNTTGSIGSNATPVGAGGGGGGGAAANSTASAAGGGAPTIFAVRTLSGTFVSPGNGTTTMNATANTAYYPVKAGLPGISGGGGAYKTATNGGNGGNAINHNAGGGGGGASDNGYDSGAGGRGADGCVVITTYF